MSRSNAQPSLSVAHDVRCTCGALIARERDGWIEVRCRRCKRGLRLRKQDERLLVESLPDPAS